MTKKGLVPVITLALLVATITTWAYSPPDQAEVYFILTG